MPFVFKCFLFIRNQVLVLSLLISFYCTLYAYLERARQRANHPKRDFCRRLIFIRLNQTIVMFLLQIIITVTCFLQKRLLVMLQVSSVFNGAQGSVQL